jgi:PAS domain S-box-containing protein
MLQMAEIETTYFQKTHHVDSRDNPPRQLEELRYLHDSVINNMEGAHYLFSTDGILVSINRVGAAMAGGAPSSLIGKSVYEYLPESDAVFLAERMESLKAMREQTIYEDIVKEPDGEKCYRSVFQLIENDSGYPSYIQLTIKDNTSVFEAEAKLKKTVKALSRSNEELSQFAWVSSHDLQTPLRLITSYLQLLKKKYGGQLDQDAHEFIEFAAEGAKRMSTQINELRIYSQLDLQEENFILLDTGQIADKAISILIRDIEKIGGTVTRSTLPLVRGNEDLVLLLFRNLIENAVKYRRDVPPKVVIGAELDGDEWRFFVEDNGMGIEEQYQKRIFDIFQRLHNDSDHRGTGIGLAMCKKIVTRLGGRIWVRSERDKGSTFYFTIPKPKERRDNPESRIMENKSSFVDDVGIKHPLTFTGLSMGFSTPAPRFGKGADMRTDIETDEKDTLDKNEDDALGQEETSLEQRLRQCEAQLALAMEMTRQTAKELEQFAYVASHDLQEPVRMVKSYLQLLVRRYGETLDDGAKEFVGFAVDSAERMSRLINDLLTYSRVMTKGKPLEPTDSGKTLNAAIVRLERKIEKTGATIRIAENLPTVSADEKQLTEVFVNLLDNAMKFSGENAPVIEISAEAEGEFRHFTVKDNGIGIDAKNHERVFDIFQQLHRRGEFEGTGMGLAFCKKIVGRHNGKMWVASEAGKGATFHFTMPA